jgi:hypothetical protein
LSPPSSVISLMPLRRLSWELFGIYHHPLLLYILFYCPSPFSLTSSTILYSSLYRRCILHPMDSSQLLFIIVTVKNSADVELL